jgi:hypothetical protein
MESIEILEEKLVEIKKVNDIYKIVELSELIDSRILEYLNQNKR